jgi:hypothetical protein
MGLAVTPGPPVWAAPLAPAACGGVGCRGRPSVPAAGARRAQCRDHNLSNGTRAAVSSNKGMVPLRGGGPRLPPAEVAALLGGMGARRRRREPWCSPPDGAQAVLRRAHACLHPELKPSRPCTAHRPTSNIVIVQSKATISLGGVGGGRGYRAGRSARLQHALHSPPEPGASKHCKGNTCARPQAAPPAQPQQRSPPTPQPPHPRPPTPRAPTGCAGCRGA